MFECQVRHRQTENRQRETDRQEVKSETERGRKFQHKRADRRAFLEYYQRERAGACAGSLCLSHSLSLAV
jgi:hypothetical protein